MKKVIEFFLEIFETVFLALIIVIPIRLFIFQPFIVKGASMEPTFHTGDYLIIDELTYRFRPPKRGEIIVFKFPQDESQRFIKRLIGLPGETIEISNSKIKITSGEESFFLDETSYLKKENLLGEMKITLGENEYFVLGDNRPYSFDSMEFGPIKKREIVGRVILRLWPPKGIKLFLKTPFEK